MPGDTDSAKAGSKKVIIALDGVGGTVIMPQTLALAMKWSGSDHTVQKFFWTHGIGQPLKDLQDSDNIEKKSLELFALLQKFLAEGASVQVVAKSGGSIIAVKALERLPSGSVDRLVLLSPAISPGYDLSPALRAVDKKMVCFYSKLDKVYLSLGTSVFGTSDGVRGASAGCLGFQVPAPECAEVEQYSKLEQVPWDPSMMRRLHIGMHLGNSMLPWLMKYVVPVLRYDEETAPAELRST
jgi:pimeloyl-ACP methyl ester carboxylesterase